jgi:uncharacterized membrane protein (DUF4010 family)
MLYPRVIAATAILNPAMVVPLATLLAAPAALAGAWVLPGLRRARPDGGMDVDLQNPLQLREALHMAALFQAVLMAVHVAREYWGASGVLSTAAILGLTDVDALTVSMARGAAQAIPPADAAAAIAVGVLANTALKLGLAVLLGSVRFKIIAGGALALMLGGLAAALAIARS